MRTWASLGQPYRFKCASFGQAVVGEMTALLTLVDPRSSCISTSKLIGHTQEKLWLPMSFLIANAKWGNV